MASPNELEQALGVGDGQGSPACCGPWGCKESDMTEQLNQTVLVVVIVYKRERVTPTSNASLVAQTVKTLPTMQETWI